MSEGGRLKRYLNAAANNAQLIVAVMMDDSNGVSGVSVSEVADAMETNPTEALKWLNKLVESRIVRFCEVDGVKRYFLTADADRFFRYLLADRENGVVVNTDIREVERIIGEWDAAEPGQERDAVQQKLYLRIGLAINSIEESIPLLHEKTDLQLCAASSLSLKKKRLQNILAGVIEISNGAGLLEEYLEYKPGMKPVFRRENQALGCLGKTEIFLKRLYSIHESMIPLIENIKDSIAKVEVFAEEIELLGKLLQAISEGAVDVESLYNKALSKGVSLWNRKKQICRKRDTLAFARCIKDDAVAAIVAKRISVARKIREELQSKKEVVVSPAAIGQLRPEKHVIKVMNAAKVFTSYLESKEAMDLATFVIRYGVQKDFGEENRVYLFVKICYEYEDKLRFTGKKIRHGYREFSEVFAKSGGN